MSAASSSKPESSTASASTSAPAPAVETTKAALPTAPAATTKPGLEAKKAETADDKIARAKAMNDRFKRRGKRTATAAGDGDSSGTPASKKAKNGGKDSKDPHEGMPDEYRREVQSYMDRSLKDEGAGKRPLVR
ncbi:hypothetical protein P389DRAFT_166796 [Cystobasidium minutum MCA 4210]|uniref:uncharacterized protein n=1 Tax=Cystobasidium minutum MCA 4210 TaxID=1397322 RepID=UPI0034CFF1C5|eukprot:jgi/Rhomi1/166796/fgenesh1_kg.2_\